MSLKGLINFFNLDGMDAKVFNDNINEIAEAHHILLEKTLKEREIVFQRRRKRKNGWIPRTKTQSSFPESNHFRGKDYIPIFF